MITVSFTGTPLTGDEPLSVTFTSTVTITDEKTGGKGDNPKRKKLSIYKPTGIVDRPKKVEAKAPEENDQAEIASELAKEFSKDNAARKASQKAIQDLSDQERNAELRARLLVEAKRQKEEDEAFMLFMLRIA